MVLLIGGLKVDQVPRDSRSLYSLAPHLKETGLQFANVIPKVVDPKELLYISQREFAVCHPQDGNISYLGTDDCTTCMAVVLRHPATGVMAVGHFESLCVDGLVSMISRIQQVSGGYYEAGGDPLLMHIVGSYCDTRGYSEQLIFKILNLAHSQSTELELTTACVGEVNTVIRGNIPWPILYGIGVNVKTGQVFPATFPDKGPDLPLRMARIFTGSYDLLEVYECESGYLRVGPFTYSPMRSAPVILQQSDEFILNHLSSSPDVEPPHVVHETKNALRHIQEHPFPEITIFPDNRPRYYKQDEQGRWNPVPPDTESGTV